MRPIATLATAAVLVACADWAAANEAQADRLQKHDATQEEPSTLMPSVIVIASPLESPLEITLDPSLPRQPVPASDATDYLKTVPGFSAVRTGGANGDTVFRGMFGSRLNILANGGNLLGGCGGRMDSPTSYISPESYDSVTITKGPQTVLWGGGAYAATIRFDRLPEHYTETETRLRSNVLAGSNGRFDTFLDASTGAKTGYIRVIGNHAKAADYKDGNGDKIPSKWHKWNTDAIVGWTPDEDTVLELSMGRGDGYARYADRSLDGTSFKRESAGLRLQKNNIGAVLDSIEIQSYYNDVDHIMDNYRLRSQTGTKILNNPSRRVYGGRALTTWLLNDAHTLTTGVDTQYDMHRSRSGLDRHAVPWNKNIRFNHYGVFGELSSKLDESSRIVTGLRADHVKSADFRRSSTTQGRKRTETLPGGFIRLEQESAALPVLWYAGLGYTERFPDYWELSQSIVPDGARNAFKGLKPEKALQLDIGLQYNAEPVNIWASAYAGTIRDYILFDYGDAKGVSNVDARIMGAELGAGYRLTRQIKLDSSLAYAWGKNSSDGTALPQIPPLEVRLNLGYQHEKWQAGLLWRIVAAQNRIARNKGNVKGKDFDSSSGFGILSANGSYQPHRTLKLSAGIDNLFDRAYSEHLNMAGSELWGLSADKRLNEPGRTCWAKMSLDF